MLDKHVLAHDVFFAAAGFSKSPFNAMPSESSFEISTTTKWSDVSISDES